MPKLGKRPRSHRCLMVSEAGMSWLEFALVALLVGVVLMLVLLALPALLHGA